MVFFLFKIKKKKRWSLFDPIDNVFILAKIRSYSFLKQKIKIFYCVVKKKQKQKQKQKQKNKEGKKKNNYIYIFHFFDLISLDFLYFTKEIFIF